MSNNINRFDFGGPLVLVPHLFGIKQLLRAHNSSISESELDCEVTVFGVELYQPEILKLPNEVEIFMVKLSITIAGVKQDVRYRGLYYGFDGIFRFIGTDVPATPDPALFQVNVSAYGDICTMYISAQPAESVG